MSDLDLLFISNGHGEDAIAARIARELDGLRLAGLPLVGTGSAYRDAGLAVLGPARDSPSGGWGLRSPILLRADLREGWLSGMTEAPKAARAARPRLVAGVGDLLPAAVAAICGLPCVLVGCNKSDYYRGWGESYLAIEVAALRCWGTEVLPRDRLTWSRLDRLGLRTLWLGNVMPDLVGEIGPPGAAVALLPGSRADARANLPLMLEAMAQPILAHPSEPPRQILVVLAPNFEDLEESVHRAGAQICDLDGALAPAGVAIATAGTASEVAAAHGRPVVAFAGPGPQYTPYFARRQKDLLGPALVLCARTPVDIAAAAAAILADDELRSAAAVAGRERVGEPGAARAIARHLALRLVER